MVSKLDIIIGKFSELLEKSELRIDSTNKMISECLSIITSLKNEYCKHIGKLQESRDELISQNKKLIEENCLLLSKVDKMNTRLDTLVDKIINMKDGKNLINVN